MKICIRKLLVSHLKRTFYTVKLFGVMSRIISE